MRLREIMMKFAGLEKYWAGVVDGGIASDTQKIKQREKTEHTNEHIQK